MERLEIERVWGEHIEAEFGTRDTEAALATMVEDAEVDNVPVHTGARGIDDVRAFYRDDFIPSWPADVEIRPVNRVVGEDQLVDELHVTFSHAQPMEWLLPGVAPTGRRIEMDVVVVVQFRGDKIAAERIYWDHATVLRQVGLLEQAAPVPGAGR